ncbi:5'-methylthioadenosine/S-adenosylhomocysteine nucleosidase [Actibacterium atlanticum]|uniref:5'-methylthioadenosine/S-adenosylhomocysteine nucleosidase n=1 Tax=Actibacterium atlanticum TaxID=1461693 RepID=A0A058ZMY5_9RHOB|nr:5'-methylthioadenosine/S-adenosylhomocysteine nucleosidase [Actibacterium atlanticum]KCV82547.1 5'-methylthioadenosine/S-adenosylhomocysteine nucleosidase [Actibacterium atlanticum]
MAQIKEFGTVKTLFVMAAEPEYGEHLQQRFVPLITGVGPVEGAIAITRHLAALDELPDLVISIGSAGSAKLRKTDIYQVTEVGYRDMDASPLGFPKGITPFLGLPATLPLPLRIADVPQATLSTGANIISGAMYQDIDADLVDMETFAILRACHQFDLPLIALRGVSDGDAELSDVTDWTEYLHIIDEKLAAIIDQIGDALGARGLSFGGYSAELEPKML